MSRNWCICDATAIAARKPTNIAAPPSVGIAFVCTCRASVDGCDDGAEPDGQPADDRRERERRHQRNRADDRVAPHESGPLTSSGTA